LLFLLGLVTTAGMRFLRVLSLPGAGLLSPRLPLARGCTKVVLRICARPGGGLSRRVVTPWISSERLTLLSTGCSG
jgi:hypothetical protein